MPTSFLARVLHAGAAALLVTAASCSSDEGGSSESTLQIKGFFDLSGPTKEVLIPLAQGIRDAVDEVNETGGIRGHRVELKFLDSGYSPDAAIGIYDQWSKQPEWPEVVAIFGTGTDASRRLLPRIAADAKPFFGPYAADLSTPVPLRVLATMADGSEKAVDVPGAPYNFHPGTDYSTSIRIALHYIKEHKTDGTKVAFAFDPECEYCFAPIGAGKAHAKELALGTAAADLAVRLAEPGYGYADIDAAVAAYFAGGANADVEWIWMGNTTETTAMLARAVAKYAPPTTKIMTNVYGFDENLAPLCALDLAAGAPNPCFDRVFGVTPFSMYGDQRQDGMLALMRIHDAHRRPPETTADFANVRYVQGYTMFLMWRIAVERVVDAGLAIDGPNLKNALETFRDVSMRGLSAPLTITPTDHRPTRGAMIYKIDDTGAPAFLTQSEIELREEWKGW